MSINVSSAQDYTASGTTRKELNFFLLSNKGFMLSYTTDTKSKSTPNNILHQTKLFPFSNSVFTYHNSWDGGLGAMMLWMLQSSLTEVRTKFPILHEGVVTWKVWTNAHLVWLGGQVPTNEPGGHSLILSVWLDPQGGVSRRQPISDSLSTLIF